jgi:hypothetical protein
MSNDVGPVGRALLALEAIRAAPGITGARLAAWLGVTDRAAPRYAMRRVRAQNPGDMAATPDAELTGAVCRRRPGPTRPRSAPDEPAAVRLCRRLRI